MLAGGALLVIVAGATGEFGQVHLAAISLKSLLGLAFLIVFGSLLGYTSYVWLLRHVSAARVSTYAYVNPVVAVFLGWAFDSEPVTWVTLVSAAVILSSVALITVSRGRHSQPQAAPTAETETAARTEPSHAMGQQ